MILIFLWISVLGFIAYEFINAKKMPAKYAKLKPRNIRLFDIVAAILILLTIRALADD